MDKKLGQKEELIMHTRKAMKTCEMQRQSVAAHGQSWRDDDSHRARQAMLLSSTIAAKCNTMQGLRDVASNQMTTQQVEITDNRLLMNDLGITTRH